MKVWGYIINIRNIRLRNSSPVSLSIFINAFHFRSLRHKVFNSFALFGESEESFLSSVSSWRGLSPSSVACTSLSTIGSSLQDGKSKSSYALYYSSSSSLPL